MTLPARAGSATGGLSCTSWASEILSAGSNTTAGMSPSASQTANTADVSPVDAQPTAADVNLENQDVGVFEQEGGIESGTTRGRCPTTVPCETDETVAGHSARRVSLAPSCSQRWHVARGLADPCKPGCRVTSTSHRHWARRWPTRRGTPRPVCSRACCATTSTTSSPAATTTSAHCQRSCHGNSVPSRPAAT